MLSASTPLSRTFCKLAKQEKVLIAFDIAAWSMRTQEDTHLELAKLVGRMRCAGAWRVLAYVEHLRYDETPFSVRLEHMQDVPERQTAKVMMVESCFAFVG